MSEKLQKHILKRLLRHRKIGEKYTRIEWVISGVPDHEKDMTQVKKAIKELRKKGWIELHKNNKCISITRNTGRREEAKKYAGYKPLFSFLF